MDIAALPGLAKTQTPPRLDVVNMTKQFGGFTALDAVSMTLKPGTVHALLGENGAGKSTLVKCVMGFYHPTSGQVLIDQQQRAIQSPKDAHTCGIGMVYQHFTSVPAMTVAENLVLARSEEHTSELQSPVPISYAVFCLKKKKIILYLNLQINNNEFHAI